MFKTLVQPHIDYCSQLWMPQEGPNLEKVEKVLRDFSRRVPGIRQLNYWERLKSMSMNSEQRRLERYKLIYIWKIMQGSVPNCGLSWTKIEERRGRICDVPKLKGGSVVQKLRRQNFLNVWAKIVERPPKKSEEYKQLQSRPVQRSTWLFPQQSSWWAQNWNTHTWSHWCDDWKSNKLFGVPVWKEDGGVGPLRHQLWSRPLVTKMWGEESKAGTPL